MRCAYRLESHAVFSQTWPPRYDNWTSNIFFMSSSVGASYFRQVVVEWLRSARTFDVGTCRNLRGFPLRGPEERGYFQEFVGNKLPSGLFSNFTYAFQELAEVLGLLNLGRKIISADFLLFFFLARPPRIFGEARRYERKVYRQLMTEVNDN